MEYANRSDVIVLALPRGGVPIGYEVALALGAPLDVFVVRKIGVPWNEEVAIGAVASGGICQPAVARDPFFDQPYESTAVADAQPAWEAAAKANPARSGMSANIKPKKKVAALFKTAG